MSDTTPKKQTHWVMDYETLCNCFVAVFEHYTDDNLTKVFTIYDTQNDFPSLVKFLNDCRDLNQWHISYNGLAFDAQITQHILSNQKTLLKLPTSALITDLYKYAQSVIEKSNKGEFQQYSPRQLKIRQIDLFKMNHCMMCIGLAHRQQLSTSRLHC